LKKLSDQDIILADDYGKNFRENFLGDDKEDLSEADTSFEDNRSNDENQDQAAAHAENAISVSPPGSQLVPPTSGSSWSSLLKGRFSPSPLKRGITPPKPTQTPPQCATPTKSNSLKRGMSAGPTVSKIKFDTLPSKLSSRIFKNK